nr:hypothetical protein CTI12_AA402710 [Tanacetum cinerariifolium]
MVAPKRALVSQSPPMVLLVYLKHQQGCVGLSRHQKATFGFNSRTKVNTHGVFGLADCTKGRTLGVCLGEQENRKGVFGVSRRTVRDTCNNMVICWIMVFVSESIARSIMFVGTTSKIWQQLEKRFSLSDGSRKYKLNKDTDEITQFSCSVESQRLLFKSSANIESLALLSKGIVKDKCSIFSFKWHPPEKCWEKQMNQFSVEEEIDHHQFVAGIACLSSHLDLLELLEDWIYDTGVSNHMTPVEDNDSQCVVSFYSKLCVVHDLTTKKVTRLGRLKEGLYHLVNVPAHKMSDSFEALKSFIKFVTTQFEKKVKILRSDNALEFFKGQRGPYLASQGIVHQTSCMDRPQQNGRKDPVNFKEAIADPSWCSAMDVKLKALEENDGIEERKKDRLVVQEVYMKPPLGYTGKGHNVSAVSSLDSQLTGQVVQWQGDQ